MRIYLIGMPGSGKSTIGKKLAKLLKYEFIDMDNYIEKKACMFVDEIFDSYGEEYFRELERNTLKEFLDMDNIIISTGGGIIKNKNNKDLMNGKIIYLKVDLNELEMRCNNSNTVRPLLKVKTIEELYNERKELYDYFKDIEILNNNMDDAIENIMEVLK